MSDDIIEEQEETWEDREEMVLDIMDYLQNDLASAIAGSEFSSGRRSCMYRHLSDALDKLELLHRTIYIARIAEPNSMNPEEKIDIPNAFFRSFEEDGK
jgi:hypothetical protein